MRLGVGVGVSESCGVLLADMSSLLKNIHLDMEAPGPQHHVSLVKGDYQYWHYCCDGCDDRVCVYLCVCVGGGGGLLLCAGFNSSNYIYMMVAVIVG